MRIVTISSKRQITLPKDVLDLLQVQPSEKVVIRVAKGSKKKTAFLEPLRTTIVNQTAGSLTRFVNKSKLDTPLYKVLKEAKRNTAKRLVKAL